jgi:soluble P-type ATPase
MKKIEINIPNYKKLALKNIVLDYNGTLAKDGKLKKSVKKLLPILSKKYALHIITADTFGSVQKEVADFDVKVKVLQSKDHTQEKAKYIKELGKSSCVAFGNGKNDSKMLKNAALGIAVIGDEGCAKETLLQSDIVCTSIKDALELFVEQKRLIATLRK